MKKYLSITLLLVFSLLSAQVSAVERGRHIIVTKVGNFKLNNSIQSSSRNFAENSKKVFGVEYEWHMWKGLSIGGEFFHYTNDFTATSVYEAETTAHLFNLKYYFNHKKLFQPFIGIGQGISLIFPTGETFIGSHTGLASQVVAGFTYRFKRVGIYAEYKILKNKTKDNFRLITSSEIDASGKGLLVGVNILF